MMRSNAQEEHNLMDARKIIIAIQKVLVMTAVLARVIVQKSVTILKLNAQNQMTQVQDVM